MGAAVVAAVSIVASYGASSAAVTAGWVVAGGFGAAMIGGAAGLATSMVGGAMLGGGAKPKGGGSFGTEAQDRKLTLRSSVESRKLIYGLVKVSGPLALKATTGGTKEYLHLAVPLATREVAEIGDVWFDDTLATDARISGFNRVKKHLGAPSQQADADLMAEVPGWTAQHRGRGIAHIYARAKYDSTAWPNSVKSVLGLVRGHYLYDPRAATVAIISSSAASPAVVTTGAAHGLSAGDWIFVRGHSAALSKFYVVATAPSSTSLTLLDPVTGEAVALAAGGAGGTLSKMAWSHNAALCILDYLLWTDGLNANEAEVHWDTWIASANVCEEQVALGASATLTANAGTDVVTLSAPVSWATGLSVRLSSTGVLPAPLAAGTTYYWIRLSATTGKLAATSENAGYGAGVDLTDAGSGAHTVSCALTATVDATADTITTASPAHWHTGDGVRFLEGTPPTGLALGTTYYWIRTGDSNGKLAATFAAAMAGTALDLADAGTGLTIARVSQPRYTCNGVVDLGKKPIDNMEQLLTCCGGAMPYIQGRYRLHAACAGVPISRALTESDLRGSLKIRPRPPKREVFNAVRGTFVDPAQLWQPTDFVPQLSAGYLARDGGERICKDKELPYTTDGVMAQRLARIDLERADQGITVDYPANLAALPIAMWDVVPLSIANLGWVRKSFRVMDWKLAEDGGVDLVLQEEAPEVYDWSPSEASHADPAPNTLLANPWDVAAPTGLALTTGAAVYTYGADGTIRPRLRVNWSAPADVYVTSGGRIELQQRQAGVGEFEYAGSCDGGDTQLYLTNVQDGLTYDVRLRAVNGLRAVSDWVQASLLVEADPPAVSVVSGLTATITPAGIALGWTLDPAPWVTGYDIALDSFVQEEGYAGSAYLIPPTSAAPHAVQVRGRDLFGQVGEWSDMVVTPSAPASPLIAAAIVGAGIKYDLTPPSSSFALAGYKVREGATWAAGAPLGDIAGTTLTVAATSGAVRRWFAAVDAAGNVGTPASADITILAPYAPSVTASIVGGNIRVAWTHNLGSLPLASSAILHGAVLETATLLSTGLVDTSLQFPGSTGSHRFWVRDTDSAGNTGPAGMVELIITAPSAAQMTLQTIDNNVLARWPASSGTLPIATYEFAKGSVYETAEVIGQVAGLFTAVFEANSGEYTYWLTPIDVAENRGEPSSSKALISQPPDYVLYADMTSDLSGALDNALLADGAVHLPVDVARTVGERVTTFGWASRQEKIDAGFPYVLEPTPPSGSYTEEVDYGVVLPGCKVTITPSSTILHGAVSLACNIQVREADTSPWTDLGDLWSAYGQNFRYVRFTITATPDGGGNDLAKISAIAVKLDVKQVMDSGTVQCVSSDASGTSVPFNIGFLDVNSITLTPGVSDCFRYFYEFDDVPNPTAFNVYMFDQSGGRLSGACSWKARGIPAGV